MNKVIIAVIALIIGFGTGFILFRERTNLIATPFGCNEIIAKGPMGDILVRVRATPELMEIVQAPRTAQFLSIPNPRQHITKGYALVNMHPWKKDCYRIFFGTAEDMNEDMYAVEVCER